MEKNPLDIAILIIAIVSLIIGLSIYFYFLQRPTNKYFNAVNVVSWMLTAIFPAFSTYLFFPSDTSAEGELMGFKVGGAFAAFILTWYMGVKYSTKGMEVDTLQAQIEQLKKERETLTVKGQAKSEQNLAKPLLVKDILRYKLKKVPTKTIGLITGNIANITEADIWVNSENTNMQMARFYDRSISATIRYLGARRHKISKMVAHDTIYDELQKKLEGILFVEPAAVVSTDSGELLKRNNVQKIFHVATSRGQLGSGYVPVENIENCITACLEETKEEAFQGHALKSILFPLIGTGTSQKELHETAQLLIETAIGYLATNPDISIDEVYFLAFTNIDLAVCKDILDNSPRISPQPS